MPFTVQGDFVEEKIVTDETNGVEFSLSPLLVDYFPTFDYAATRTDIIKVKQTPDVVSSCALKYTDSQIGTRNMRIYVYEGYISHMEI